MSRFLYADHAATTALSPRALEAMMPYFRDTYGNPSSLYASRPSPIWMPRGQRSPGA